MRKYPDNKPSKNPNSMTAQLSHEMEVDKQDLHDWFAYCRRHRPDVFKKWTIERFQGWNDERLARIDSKEKYDASRTDSLDGLDWLGNRILLAIVMVNGGVCDDDVMECAVALKNQLVSEHRAKPIKEWPQRTMRELAEFLAPYFKPGSLSDLATKELANIRKDMPKRIEV